MTENLIWMVKNGELDDLKVAIDTQKVDVNHEINGRMLIHYASDYGQTEVVNYLISKGADVNAIDKHGISALLAAIWEGHTQCVKTLLNSGASKVGKTPDGTSYIDAAEKAEIKALLTA